MEAFCTSTFIKLSGLPGRDTQCGYEYKSHIAIDNTLLLSALCRTVELLYILAL